MKLRLSQFMHLVRLGPDRALALHALTHMRLGLNDEVLLLLEWFKKPRKWPQEAPELAQMIGQDEATILSCVASLFERDAITLATPEEELKHTVELLTQTQGRDPGEMIARYRRAHHEGAQDYWALSHSRNIQTLSNHHARLDLVLLGECDIQMEAEFLPLEGVNWGLDMRVAATFIEDVEFLADHKHDAVLVGALRERSLIMMNASENAESYDSYIAAAHRLLTQIRAYTSAPILIDMLPEPTVQPLGVADRGVNRRRNRFRRANLALEQACEAFAEVYPIDVAATLGAAGAETLLDDGLTDYAHFGSPGWMLQRADSEKAAVHHLFPDLAPLANMLKGDPYRREKIMARAHVETLMSILGLQQKKCVIVDLDGVLWPGVLAETGAPFAWSSDISGPYSFIGLYFGLHEALKTLKERGIILAAVSKNDEAVVRELWNYPAHYPHHRLLTPDDFASWRVNWRDKATNIQEIARELGFSEEAFLFIDDHPVERERVRQHCSGVEVWGEELFSLRRRLLTDPRLMPARLTRESSSRTQLVKAQIDRNRLRESAQDENAFLTSLEIVCEITRLCPNNPLTADYLKRIQELFQRTTQFNATGAKFTLPELEEFVSHNKARIYAMNVCDRFANHGLAGAAIVIDDEIRAFALSCRIIGLKAEQRLLEAIVIDHAQNLAALVGRIFETPRNAAVRNLYRNGGFEERARGEWRIKTNGAHAQKLL